VTAAKVSRLNEGCLNGETAAIPLNGVSPDVLACDSSSLFVLDKLAEVRTRLSESGL
jgi:hypothetical protein